MNIIKLHGLEKQLVTHLFGLVFSFGKIASTRVKSYTSGENIQQEPFRVASVS